MNIDDLCNLIALEQGHGATPSSVRRCLEATYQTILRQLELSEEITFWRFGKFEIFDRPSGDREMYDVGSGRKTIKYVKPKKNIKFYPSSVLDKSINENNFKILQRNKKVKNKTKKEIQAHYDAKRRPPKERLSMEEIMVKDLQGAIDRVNPPKKKGIRNN